MSADGKIFIGALSDVDYRDTGCPLSPSCLACPLRRCVEETGGLAKYMREQRDRGILDDLGAGRDPSDIAQEHGLSRLQVVRIAHRMRVGVSA